jgi:hypothetical protein
MILFRKNFTADFNTFIADKYIIRPGNKPPGVVPAFPAE